MGLFMCMWELVSTLSLFYKFWLVGYEKGLSDDAFIIFKAVIIIIFYYLLFIIFLIIIPISMCACPCAYFGRI